MWTISKKILYILYCVLGKWMPESRRSKIGKSIRAGIARHILKKAGVDINIERGAYFTPWVTLGDHSGIGINCSVNAAYAEVIIGDYVMMGPEVIIYTGQHEYGDTSIPMQKQGISKKLPVIIGNDVWIGRRAIIMPGVTIGNGCIIGAGAVVTKSVPDYAIVGGVPAKIIKKRK